MNLHQIEVGSCFLSVFEKQSLTFNWITKRKSVGPATKKQIKIKYVLNCLSC